LQPPTSDSGALGDPGCLSAPARLLPLGRISAAALVLIAAIHFALFGYFLFRTAITSPISDMFTYIADYLQLRSGQIGLANYLWRPHGEHRLVWVRLLTWVDVELLHTRGIAFMAAASASICATALLVWHQVRRAGTECRRRKSTLAVCPDALPHYRQCRGLQCPDQHDLSHHRILRCVVCRHSSAQEGPTGT
jgi:hypothetical protein